jgi:RND family efflux transporter MFP subunit
MASGGTAYWKRLLLIPPIALGGAVLAWQLAGRSMPEQAEPAEVARPVRVIEARAVDFVPRALGFGYVQPGTVWEAIAEVAGRIVYRHPDLESGRVLDAGTVILRIDPVDYELAVARIEAGLESVAAQLAELGIREANTGRLLKIERRALALQEQDHERKRKLAARGNASQATVDQAENAVLTQRQKVQDLENQLNLIPAERRVLEADRTLREAELEEARRDLARTEIRMPFAARIAEVAVEADEFVAVNTTLAVGDSIDVAEVAAQFAPQNIRPLVSTDLEIASLSAEELAVVPKRWGLSARVRFRTGDLEAEWDARFDRVSDTVDPQTRTFGFVVAVDEPYRKVIPGARPPLIKNMYVEVELRAAARPGTIVVPRAALYEGRDGQASVYLVDADDRLAIRPVTVGPAQSDFVVIESGIAPGERVVVSDLIPAIEGMLLVPRRDDDLEDRLAASASGESALK